MGKIDDGIENYGAVNGLLEKPTRLGRLLARIDIVYSNSMIEAWWREMKHAYLFTQVLDSVEAVTKHVDKYVVQHNSVVGRAIFDGRTPDKIYAGNETMLPGRLADERSAARRARVAWNRSRSCQRCSGLEESESNHAHRIFDANAA